MKKLFFLLLVSLLYAQSNITWTDITSNYSTLPAGVKLYKGTRSSSLLVCYYLDVDMNNKNIAVRPYIIKDGVKKGITTFTSSVGAYAAINGGYFGGSDSYSACIYPGEVKAQNVASVTRDGKIFPVSRAFFGIKSNRKSACEWIYHFGSTLNDVWKLNQPTNNPSSSAGTPAPTPTKADGKLFDSLFVGIGGGPMLIKNGQINITYNQEVFWGSGVSRTVQDPRTAVGYTANNHIILFVADGRSNLSYGLTLDELASVMKELGCVEAINLDGGGSTQMAVKNQLINAPSDGTERGLVTILAVTHADSAKFPKQYTWEEIIDNDKNDPRFQLVGSWITTANSGYYGTTVANIKSAGDGSSYAQYNVSPPQNGNYDVFGWWVASTNRSKKTPYIIYHNNKYDTVYADQTLNNGMWVKLGTFYFNNQPGQFIKISDKAPNSTGLYVVADAVRIATYDEIVSVENNNLSNKNYIIFKNYPNPFNPTTKIYFNLPYNSNIELNIYNILGIKVATIANGHKKAGEYYFDFDASNLPAGLYLAQLKTDFSSHTIKMQLVK